MVTAFVGDWLTLDLGSRNSLTNYGELLGL